VVNDPADKEKELHRLGFKEPTKAHQLLHALMEKQVWEEGLNQFLYRFSKCPDPDAGLGNLERFSLARGKCAPLSSAELDLLMPILSQSRFLSNLLVRSANLWDEIIAGDYLTELKAREVMEEEIRSAIPQPPTLSSFMIHLRAYKYRELLRIALRDLAGLAELPEVCQELSHLADSCIQLALEFCQQSLNAAYGTPRYHSPDGQERECEFAVLGLGKLGGEELNFSSDVDLFYVYSSDRGETDGIDKGGLLANKVSLHQYYVKLCELMTKVLASMTPDGFVFRVDLRLRPEGSQGDLANSLRSAEIYYESWGQAWERLALLKARPVAGSLSLGAQFMKIVEPFVYRKYLDFTAIEEVKELKWRIEQSLPARRGEEVNVKLGWGGIREIEFFVQSLQVVYGGKFPQIREKNTLRGLDELAGHGLITKEDCHSLKQAYIFLRKVEHRIQLLDERQWHTLPTEKGEQVRLARGMGFSGWADFISALNETRAQVASLYQGLFASREPTSEEEPLPEMAGLFAEGLPQESLQERLVSLGFADPRRAASVVAMLRDGPPFSHLSFKARRSLKKIAPHLLAEIRNSPNPDMALVNLESFVSRMGTRGSFYSLLAENAQTLRIIVGIFGTSQFLSRLLIRHPELIDALVSEEAGSEETAGDLGARLSRGMREAVTLEEKLDLIRRFRNLELLKIGVQDISGHLDPFTIMAQLSDLADACVGAAVRTAWEEMLTKYPLPQWLGRGEDPPKLSLTVLGLGKLGGEELSYASDLDLIFVYSAPFFRPQGQGLTPQEFFSRLATRAISMLTVKTKEGFVFRVDTRLRPSGRAGTLVSSLEGFQRYHRESGRLWERQSLVKARSVAGDEVLGGQLSAFIADFVYQDQLSQPEVNEMHRLRMRMEKELAREAEGKYNIKTGRGGIVDVEFVTQLLQLRNGYHCPEVRSSNTLRALEALFGRGLLSEPQHRTLSQGYRFLRKLENSLRIVNDLSVDDFDPEAEEAGALARRLGYSDQEELVRDYHLHSDRIRDIYLNLFAGQPSVQAGGEDGS
jgi:glutamate-ammonia-ligase adenylyltransferase